MGDELKRFQARDRSQRKLTAKPVIYELMLPHQVDAMALLNLKEKGTVLHIGGGIGKTFIAEEKK